MAGTAVVGTKNGFIYRRFGPGDWRRVFDVGFSFGTIFGLAAQRVDNSQGIGSAWTTGSIPNQLTSNNNGMTWSEQVRGSSVGFIFPERSSLDDTDNLYTVWGSGFFLTGQIWKSTDKGATWANIGAGGSPNGPQSPVVSNGYLWFLDYSHGTDSLYRCNLDGTGGTSFSGVLTGPGHQRSLTTEPGTNMLYAYGSASGTSDFVSIDVSTPASPVATAGTINVSRGVFEIHPITSTVALALCYGGGASYLYRTTDAGASWTAVRSGMPYSASGSGTDTAIAIDPNDNTQIYVAPVTNGSAPTIWLSTDQGVTWSTETVTGTGIGSVVAWSSIAVLGEQNCGPLIATDNGFIIKRTAPNTYKVVWSGGGVPHTDHDYEGQIISFTPNAFIDPTKIATMTDYGEANEPLYSLDSGETFVNPYPPTRTPSPAGFSFFGGLAKDGTYNWNVDEDGIVWVVSVMLSNSHEWWLKSTDPTATAFVPVFDFTVAAGGAFIGLTWIGEGRMWWVDVSGFSLTLYRLNLDGTGFASWHYTASARMRNMSLQGWPGTNRLIAWEWLNVATLGPAHEAPVVSIDITDPDHPSFVDTGADPFTVNFAVWDVMPLTNQILLLNTICVNGPDGLLSGGIWRSTDGGASYVQVVANTGQLGEAPTIDGAGADNEICAIAPDPGNTAEVWIAACPPYVYHSTDYGATWEVETVNMSIFDPFLAGGGVRPQEWTGLQVVCGAGSGGGTGPPPPRSGKARTWIARAG